MNHTQNLVLSGVCVFALGWGLVPLYDYVRKEGHDAKESKKASDLRMDRHSVKGVSSREEGVGRKDFADYFVRIQRLRTSEECETCFAELMEEAVLSQSEKASRMGMLLSKWGELTPRQALQKVLQEENLWKIIDCGARPAPWLSCVFSGWASKDPEAAAAFFKDCDDPRIKKDPAIPFTLVAGWAEYSPRDAWNWLASQEAHSFVYYDSCKNLVINNIGSLDTDAIPAFIAGLDERDAKRYGPRLWRNWFWEHPDSPEQMAVLSGADREAALLGSISGKTKGDLEALTRELSGRGHEEQQKILFGLAPGLISGDKVERERILRWLMENAPGAIMQNSVRSSMGDWFIEKRVEAREVLNNLPPGKEKEALLEEYKSAPLIQCF